MNSALHVFAITLDASSRPADSVSMQQPTDHMTSTELLTALGEAMYGPEWRRPLARALGYSGSQIARLGVGASVTPATRRALALWARREIGREAARAARRLELLAAAAAYSSKED